VKTLCAVSSARVLLIDDPTPYSNRHAVRKDGRQARSGVGVADRYSAGVMTERDLVALGPAMRAPLSADAVVYAWATGPNLDMHFRIMEGRGFEYVTVAFVWVKVYPKSGTHFRGTGRHVPSNAELCLQWKLPGDAPVWYPATGDKPCQIVEAPHPRYPVELDDPEWPPRMPRGARHRPSCRACRTCLAGKIIHSRKPPHVHQAIESWLGPHLNSHSMLELFATEKRSGWVTLGHAISGRDLRDELRSLANRTTGITPELPGMEVVA